MNTTHAKRLPGVIILLALMFLQPSCSCSEDDSSQCRYNTDCNTAAGEVCLKRKCVTGTSVSTESDTAITGDTTTVGTDDTSSAAAETDSRIDSDSTTESGVVECISNSQCDDGNDCTADFCNTQLVPAQCDTKLRADGLPCGNGDACMGTAICQSGECIPHSQPCEAYSAGEQCVRYEASCDAAVSPMCTYTRVTLTDNEPCYVDSPCRQGGCVDGVCVGAENPCTGESNACTAFACKEDATAENGYECEPSLAPDGQECILNADQSPCFSTLETPLYTVGYCVGNGNTADCIVDEERKCFDAASPNICTAAVCALDTGSCTDIPEADVSISVNCNETAVLTADDFLTREYYHYGSDSQECGLWDVRGAEVALKLNIDSATAVTVSVTDNGGQDISFHHLSDMCDPNSCLENAFDSLGIPAMNPTDAIIVEAGIGNPPAQLELAVSCGN